MLIIIFHIHINVGSDRSYNSFFPGSFETTFRSSQNPSFLDFVGEWNKGWKWAYLGSKNTMYDMQERQKRSLFDHLLLLVSFANRVFWEGNWFACLQEHVSPLAHANSAGPQRHSQQTAGLPPEWNGLISQQVVLTYTASVIVGLAARYIGRPELICSP